MQHILELAGEWEGGRGRARAVFACGGKKFWREFDLPPQLARTQLFVNRRFHLNQLAVVLGGQPRLWLVLVDRHRARFFDLQFDEVKERESVFRPLPRRRGDGFGGYDAGHAERSVNEDAQHHFKYVTEVLKQGLERGAFDRFIIGCQDIHWHDFEAHLHPQLKSRLLGRFAAEVGNVTEEQVREHGGRILRESLAQRQHDQVREVLSQAKSNGRGVTGLRRVLRSLEMGEVQVLLLAENYSAHAVECTGCGHSGRAHGRLLSGVRPKYAGVGGCVRCHRPSGHPTRRRTGVCEGRAGVRSRGQHRRPPALPRRPEKERNGRGLVDGCLENSSALP